MPTVNIVNAALALAEHGRPVFPCGGDKRPVTRHGFKDASTDPAIIRAMFSIPGSELIGVPTGEASGLDVLDVDPRHGGNEWLAAHRYRLPITRTHATRSGGLHLLFHHRDAVRNSAGRIGTGVDVRGEGGYIIVPPSPGYSVHTAARIAPWPEWLLVPGLALPPPEPERPISPAHAEPIADRRAAAYIDTLLHRLSRAPDGAKRDTLIRMGRALGGIIDAAGIGESEAVERLVNALPETVRDWAAARKTAAWAVSKGRESPIPLADREMGAPR
jgi:hypothetical protein